MEFNILVLLLLGVNLVWGQNDFNYKGTNGEINFVSIRCETDDCEALGNRITQSFIDKSVEEYSNQFPYMIAKTAYKPCMENIATLKSKTIDKPNTIPPTPAEKKKPKLILYWTPNAMHEGIDVGKDVFVDVAKCPVDNSNCETTDNKTRLIESDAVIFSSADFDPRNLPDPSTKRPNQRYILLMYEQLNTNDILFTKFSSNYFDWTMTRRRDSDIVTTKAYGGINRKAKTNYIDPYPVKLIPGQELSPPPSEVIRLNRLDMNDRLAGKDKSLKIAFPCTGTNDTPGKRELYIKHLQNEIAVDVINVDGTCPGPNVINCQAPSCDLDTLLKKYKFYLAAEIILATDLITERFYQHLNKDIVPIVYGGADYSKFAPTHSYINVADFKSPAEVAKYIELLHNNDALYLEYFQWKKDFEYEFNPTKSFCDLCEKLNKEGDKPNDKMSSSYGNNLAKWWLNENNEGHIWGDKYLEKLGIH